MEANMIRSLVIRNFTIIESLEIEFDAGFGAITGETGAGKSILIDALGQILGDRADTDLVAENAARAELSAVFDGVAPESEAGRWLSEQGLDLDELVVRRVIPAEGSSRAWINGQPATVGQLRELGTRLIEIHGQHAHQRLADPVHQRSWLDSQVDATVREAVREAADEHQTRSRDLRELVRRFGDGSDVELMRYQLRELDELALEEHEWAELEAEHRRLASVDELQQAYGDALASLDGDPDGAAALVHRAHRQLDAVADREPALAELLELLDTARVHLDEAVTSLQRFAESLEHDPARLAQIDQRLSRAMSLARKHELDPEALPALRRRLADHLGGHEDFESEREAAENRLEQARTAWLESADALNQARCKAAADLSGRVATALAELGMSGARLEFRVDAIADAPVAAHGADRVEILFSANPGQSPKPLKQVASGGELSRLGLALIVAGGTSGASRVRVFDEIDAGVGGETAHAVGRFLRQAAERGQAFCVTHLAQVAARADHQFKVAKRAHKGRTQVEVVALQRDERVTELARMLGSAEAGTSRRHAEAMLTDAV
jgi:DNA repair protein RecN (Recombination protein N)